MSDPQTPGFARLVPGFDFLQNLAKGATQAMPQMPNLSHWVAPTLNVEELEKRIGELKAVHFWLDQNSKALAATIQALEVQKMTLATLQGMNFNMADMANALKLQPAGAAEAGTAAAGAAGPTEPASGGAAKTARAKAARDSGKAKAAAPGNGGLVDPLQWWGALTQQFQQIAANALKDAALGTAMDTARHMATGMAKEAVKSAAGGMRGADAPAAKRTKAAKPARKAPARKKGAH